ncbi:Complex I subunit NDUFS6 [Phytophthora cactorum]|nr:Complex I subunit NDUFS6 [Phytophthora cactorum]
MYAAQLRSKDEILAIRAAEREYAKRVVREELATCYRENGVNHKMACKGLREEYAKLIQDPTHGAGYPVGYLEHICSISGVRVKRAKEGRMANHFLLLNYVSCWEDATGVLDAGWAHDKRELKRYVVGGAT